MFKKVLFVHPHDTIQKYGFIVFILVFGLHCNKLGP